MESGQDIIQTGLVSREQLEKAQALQGESGENLTYVVCKMCFADEQELAKALALEAGMEVEYLEGFEPDMEIVKKFTEEYLEDNLLVPLKREGGVLKIGVCSPLADDTLDELRMIAGEKIEVVIVPAVSARKLLDAMLYGGVSEDGSKIKVPHKKQHHSARETLGDLVEELEHEAKERGDEDIPINSAELYSYETRELVFALLHVLSERGLVSADEISYMAANLRNR